MLNFISWFILGLFVLVVYVVLVAVGVAFGIEVWSVRKEERNDNT